MANKKNSKKGRTTRRPTKAELERQKAIRRMLVTFGIAFLLLFAALKWGAVGITLYNLIRLLVGSLAYIAIIASLIYLFFFKWVNKHEGYKSGFFSIYRFVAHIPSLFCKCFKLKRTGSKYNLITNFNGFKLI